MNVLTVSEITCPGFYLVSFDGNRTGIVDVDYVYRKGESVLSYEIVVSDIYASRDRDAFSPLSDFKEKYPNARLSILDEMEDGEE